MSSFEMYKNLSEFNSQIINKINQIECLINCLTHQIEHREKYNNFLEKNEQYKKYVLEEKLFYLEKLDEYKKLYVNANNTRYI
jgi:hypothetical protein